MPSLVVSQCLQLRAQTNQPYRVLISQDTTTLKSSRIQLQGILKWNHTSSRYGPIGGAEDNFIDSDLSTQSRLPSVPLTSPKKVVALDG